MAICCLNLASLSFSYADAAAVAAENYWTVTQYANKDGKRAMFYTIEDQQGRLAIIDGGWKTDVVGVEDVIRAHNNTVDVWIITHPHPDHAGAVNVILKHLDTNGIHIGKFYTVKVDEAHYKKTAEKNDRFAVYTAFRDRTRNMDVTYVRENDVYDILGLRMKVLSSWTSMGSELRTKKKGVCNNGSMVFRLDGKKDSMLFCSDIKGYAERRLVRNHRNELAATYVQCAHHGVDGVSYRFYQNVKARAAFIDAPKSLTKKKLVRKNTPGLVKALRKMGTSVYMWNKGGNSVSLR